MSTPMRDARRLPFSSPDGSSLPPTQRRLSLRHSRLPPSPYTPFSGRRSGTLPPGTPQVERSPFASLQPAPRISAPNAMHVDSAAYSADEFVRNRLDHAMRKSTVSILAALSRTVEDADQEPEKTLLRGVCDELLKQIEIAESFLRQRSAHPYVRKELENALAALRVESATWQLVDIMWRSGDYRKRNLAAVRLAPDRLHQIDIDKASGIEKAHRIAEWLESLAAAELDRAGGPRVKPLDDPAYRNAYTAQRLDVQAVSIDYSLAEGNQLDETETKADERLCRELFKLLLAGRLEEAQNICRDAGQPWRAAILAGGTNCSALSADGKKGGARAIWRSTAAEAARQANNLPPHERALYGLLAGVKEPALLVAPDYESRAWVHFTTALDNACENALTGKSEGPGISDSDIVQMFSECAGAEVGHPSIPPEINAAIRKVRSYLALGKEMEKENVASLLEALAELGCQGVRLKHEWVCRLVANVSLFIKLTGKVYHFENNEVVMNNFENAMSAYARIVIELEKAKEEKAKLNGAIREANSLVYELAAWQLSELKSDKRIVKEYAELMVNSLVMDLRHERSERLRVGVRAREIAERRTQCLEKAGICFKRDTLNELVVFVVDRVWDIYFDQAMHNTNEVTEEDELVMRSIEFLMFPSFPNSTEAVVRATVAARRFFRAQKFAACKQVVTWFPNDAASDDVPDLEFSAIRELDAWRMYMEANQFFLEWQDYFFTNKPKPLPDNILAAANAESGSCSYEVQAAATVQVDNYNDKLDEFQRTAKQLRLAAVEAITNALEYDGGWMSGMLLADAGEGRIAEMVQVRSIAVPELVWMLHRVLHESGEYGQAMKVAEIVASETTKLYECFDEAGLKVLLTRVGDSAILCADWMIKSGVTQMGETEEQVHDQPLEQPYEGTFFVMRSPSMSN